MAADHTILGPYTILPTYQVMPVSTGQQPVADTITVMPAPFNGAAATGGATRPASGVVFPLIS